MVKKDKGKLKIFFGYSAGVGKTYAMLKTAQKLKKRHVDVVVGYYQKHNRSDTDKLLKELEVLPVKKIAYKNNTYEEFDIDLALKRKPAIILVDELAHTNIEGCRNEKRYLDVLELLDAGIDVYTTMNVQHLESLNDILLSKTENNVKETVPDFVFDNADEVILIDIDPKELLERLKSGKIYDKSKIQLALANFFTTKNLNTLREMSLRQSADKILKDENINYLANNDVVVLITPSPSSEKNIREAARMAEVNHATFTALYVEKEIDRKPSDKLEKHMELVDKLGGKLSILYGDDILNIVSNYIKLHQIKIVVLGASWSKFRGNNFENKLMTLLPDTQFYIVPYNKKKIVKRNIWNIKFDWISTLKLVFSIGILIPIFMFLNDDWYNVICIFFYFVALLFVSYKSKNWLYVFTMAFCGSLSYILLGQTIENTGIKIIIFFVMLLMGLFYGWFVYKYSKQIRKANKSNKVLDSVNILVNNLANSNGIDNKSKVVVETLNIFFNRSIYLFFDLNDKKNIAKLNDDNKINIFIDQKEQVIMEWVKKNNRRAGNGTQTLMSSKVRYEPIKNKKYDTIVLGISCEDKKLTYQDLILVKMLISVLEIGLD